MACQVCNSEAHTVKKNRTWNDGTVDINLEVCATCSKSDPGRMWIMRDACTKIQCYINPEGDSITERIGGDAKDGFYLISRENTTIGCFTPFT